MTDQMNGRPFKVMLAYCFGTAMLERIGMEDLVDANIRNAAEVGGDVCHTHDFCDANVVMYEVMEGFDMPSVPDDQDSADLWNDVWAIAKRYNFFVELNE